MPRGNPCGRMGLAFLLSAVLALNLLAETRQGGLQAASSPDPKPAEPGTVVRRRVVVSSRLPETVELLEETIVPEGWRHLPLDEPRFSLEPGQRVVRFVAVAIPKGEPGSRTVVYRLRSAADGVEVVPAIPIDVEVRGRAELRLSMGESPEFLVAGVWATNQIQLINPGGVPLRVQLRVQATPPADVRIPEESFEIRAGETRIVPMAVAPRSLETSRYLQSLRIQAQATDPGGNPVLVPLLGSSIEVIGGGPVAVDPWIRIPSRIQFGSTVDLQGRAAGVVEVNGFGTLDPESGGQVSYRLRPTVVGSSPMIFDQDQYFISYTTRSSEWMVGDGIRPLSPLMQTFGQDRGVRFENREHSTKAGALLAESVLGSAPERRSGGYLEQELAPWWSVRSAYLHQQSLLGDGSLARPVGDIGSLQTRLAWTNRLRLELEAARSDTDLRRPGSPEAYRLEFQGSLPRKAEVQVQARRVGEGYLSPGRDNDALNGSVSVPFRGQYRAEMSATRNVVGLHGTREERVGQERTGVFRSDSLSAAVHRTPTAGVRMSAGVRDRQRQLERDGTAREVSEDTAFGSVTKTFKRWTLAMDLEGGRSVQDRGSGAGSVSRMGGRVEYRPNGRQMYGLFARYGDPVLAVDLDPSLSTGLNSEWQIGDRNRLLLNGSVEQVPRTGERREFGSLQARRVRENGHEISARGQVIMADQGDDEAGFFVQYSIPFGLPVGRKKGLSGVHGRLVDRNDGLSAGVPRAVVTLNREWKTLTASDGTFEFSNLRPGAYVLEVESRSLGFGRVVVGTAPIVVQAKPDAVTRVEVGVTAGASLEVVVTVFEDTAPAAGPDSPPPESRYREKSGLAGEVVEIQMEKTVRRLATDTKGTVRFSGLVPGAWQLRIGQGSLPANHFLEPFDPSVVLKPGGSGQVKIRVLPRRRTLRFIDSDG